MTADLDVFAPYGIRAGSLRVRVAEWLAITGRDARIHTYVGQSNAGVATLTRHLLKTIRAEGALRRDVAASSGTVMINSEASPLSDGSLEERLISRAGFSLFDFDDALQWDWGYGGRLRRVIPKAPKTVRIVQSVDRVIAGNVELAEWAASIAADVVYIPSCVNPDDYTVKSNYALSDPPRIGWVGSPATEQYLRLIESALLEVHRRTGARLKVVSLGRRSLGALDTMTDRVEWNLDVVAHVISTWDIGIMPLATGLYERGKCGYKLLQYAAAALPGIGSAGGMNTGLLCRLGAPAPATTGEWVDGLLDILALPDEGRAGLGGVARAVIAEEYSYARWMERWQRAVWPD